MDFKTSLLEIFVRIGRKDRFALARYGDGEKMLMCGQVISEGTQARQQDKRMSFGNSLLGQDLLGTLDMEGEDYYYSIPCKCCNDGCKQRYLSKLKSTNLTFANVFINANFPLFKSRMERELNKLEREVVIIANKEGDITKYPFRVQEFVPMEDDCVNYYAQHKDHFLKTLRILVEGAKDKIYLISAGPLSNIMVYEMRKANPNNIYLDVGSALDIRTKGRATRGFHLENPPVNDVYARRYCIF